MEGGKFQVHFLRGKGKNFSVINISEPGDLKLESYDFQDVRVYRETGMPPGLGKEIKRLRTRTFVSKEVRFAKQKDRPLPEQHEPVESLVKPVG